MNTLFSLVLVSTAAFAQPFLSGEHVMPVGPASANAPRTARPLALVPDGDGFVAAWSAGPAPVHIFAARLNSSFQPVSPIRDFAPVQGFAFDMFEPDVARVDGGYAVTWLERERIDQPRPASAILLRLSPSLETLDTTVVAYTRDTALARIAGSDASSVSVFVDGFLYKLSSNGARDTSVFRTWNSDDAVVAGGSIATAGVKYNPPPYTYYPLCGWPCPLTSPSWIMHMEGGRAAMAAIYRSEVAGAAIGFGAGMYVAAWLSDLYTPNVNVNVVRIRANGDVVNGFDFPIAAGSYANKGTVNRPSVGSDGERFLLAWLNGANISAAALTTGGQVQNFAMTTIAGEKGNPMVVGVMPGRFAVVYEVQADADHRQLVFRYVDFKVFRAHAAR